MKTELTENRRRRIFFMLALLFFLLAAIVELSMLALSFDVLFYLQKGGVNKSLISQVLNVKSLQFL
jgi:hypothetical protein